jgi:hypothetical protein
VCWERQFVRIEANQTKVSNLVRGVVKSFRDNPMCWREEERA